MNSARKDPLPEIQRRAAPAQLRVEGTSGNGQDYNLPLAAFKGSKREAGEKGGKMKRTAYFREWHRKHPGYKAMQWRKKAVFRPSRKPRYRELLGIECR